jgi:hypothetical protein
MTSQPHRPIRDQIRQAIDPENKLLPLFDAVDANPSLPKWLPDLDEYLGQMWSEFGAHSAQLEKITSQIEGALAELVPRGWSVFNMESDAVAQATALVRAGKGDEADDLLARRWTPDTYRTGRVCDRVSTMGFGDMSYNEVFRRRAEFLRTAKGHHDKGEYAASILIVQTQMEGIVTDVTANKKFFSSRPGRAADLVDPTQLVSMESSLAALRSPFIQPVDQTQVEGSLSRHGAAHGRELAFDTKVNSSKTWSVLDAIVEWALPLARAEAAGRRSARQLGTSGSQELDEDGRRLDDREFRETKDMLRILGTSSIGWWGELGHFRRDLVGGVYNVGDFTKRGLPSQHDTQLCTSDDGQCIWFWRPTVSGWVLGMALRATDGGFLEWLYAGPAAPTGSPVDNPDIWGEPFGTPPDWTG